MPSIDLIYDGYCDFCLRSLRFVKRFDPQNKLRLVDGNDTETVRQRYPGLHVEDLQTAMYAAVDGKYFRGYDAFARAFGDLPLWPIGLFMRLWPVRFIGLRVYDLIAKNRRSFGCSSGACKI